MPALKIIVRGLVQGVGFRPFIHRLALETHVKGYVKNIGGAEVEIFIEGPAASIKEFIRGLYFKHPPPAVIEEIEIFNEKPRGYKEFSILKSSANAYKYSIIPPDIAICDECLKEILNPHDRRYRYPFNSCAWCGPRFSMIYNIPYDRGNTSMRKYPLCQDCLREYTDLNNIRRYHAQGISCPRDGPRLWLTDKDGEVIECKDPVLEAAKLIDEGYIVAIKGVGGYHIAALATDDDVVLKLRKRKGRPRKPFAIMGLDINVLSKLVYIDDASARILRSPERPILLLPKKPDTPVSKYVSPGLVFEGVFLPYTGLHYLLLMETRDKFLIMTSGNPTGKPMCTDELCLYSSLSKIVDYALVHDREIVNRVDDSVLRFTDTEVVMLRRGRGYAPYWIRLPAKLEKPVIAFGADLQMAGCIGFDDKAIPTQYIGDLDDADALKDLDKYLRFLMRCYNISFKNSIIAVDKHPGYNSRILGLKYAKEYGAHIVEVQHHVAHILATIVDRGFEGGFIGIALDGVGYGDDGAIWGGEIIYVDTHKGFYRRMGHLSYQPLVGERSIYYPIRFFISTLSTKISWNELHRLIRSFELDKRVPGGLGELRIVYEAVERGLYTKTSSTGRYLDGVSAFLNICIHRSYEGEPAIRLEAEAYKGRLINRDLFMPEIKEIGGEVIIETTGVYLELVDYAQLYNHRDIAHTVLYNLGLSLGDAVKRIIKGMRRASNKIILGGGATVNTFIVRGLRSSLREEGLDVILPKNIPPNDGGIALGQVAYVLFSLHKYE